MFHTIKLKPLLTSLALPLAAGGLSALLAGDIGAVYNTLLQPPLSPPGPVFPVVWTVLYLLMGVALYRVRQADGPERPMALALFYGQLALNAAWTPIFFRLQWFGFALLWLLLLVVLDLALRISAVEDLTNADYYGANIYKSDFNSKQTVRDMNNWVKNETDGMIPKIIEEIPPDALMYLVNALVFEAEWSDVYENKQVKRGSFTNANGIAQSVDMMYSTEGRYIEDEDAVGFIKYYVAHKYAFVALLPDEGVTVSEYLADLDGERLNALSSEAEFATVNAAIPKFETEYKTDLAPILGEMGMSDAFSPEEADFSRLGSSSDGNIYINRVIHEAHIQVGEKGTKAGAVTLVELKGGGTSPDAEPKEVYLDRPFIYMIIDCENNVPLFIATMNDVKS